MPCCAMSIFEQQQNNHDINYLVFIYVIRSIPFTIILLCIWMTEKRLLNLKTWYFWHTILKHKYTYEYAFGGSHSYLYHYPHAFYVIYVYIGLRTTNTHHNQSEIKEKLSKEKSCIFHLILDILDPNFHFNFWNHICLMLSLHSHTFSSAFITLQYPTQRHKCERPFPLTHLFRNTLHTTYSNVYISHYFPIVWFVFVWICIYGESIPSIM